MSLFFSHWGSFYLIAGLAMAFAFSNGFRDSSTIVATVVSTRALSPTTAFLLCALFEFIGAFLVGSAVVTTIGSQFFQPALAATRYEIVLVLGSALLSAVAWGAVGWWRAWPVSNNQALFSGLTGASMAIWGFEGFNPRIVVVVFIVLLSSPLLGLLASYMTTSLVRFFGGWFTPRIGPIVEKLHIASCLFVSCAHGSNDGQIVTGVLVLGLGLLGIGGGEFAEAPRAIRLIVGLSIACGVLFGGRRILKKMGMKFYQIKPAQGLGAQTASALTIFSCVAAGFPVSSMQVITGSIVGAGVAHNPKSVRWAIAGEIVLSWFITIPMVGVFSFGVCSLIKNWIG